MTVYAITDTKKGRTGIAPTYLQVGAGAAGAAFSNTALIRALSNSVMFSRTGRSQLIAERRNTIFGHVARLTDGVSANLTVPCQVN